MERTAPTRSARPDSGCRTETHLSLPDLTALQGGDPEQGFHAGWRTRPAGLCLPCPQGPGTGPKSQVRL